VILAILPAFQRHPAVQTLSIPKKKRIYAIAFAPSGRELAAVCGDGQLRVWDLGTGAVRRSAPVEHTSSGYDLAYLGEDRLALAGIDLRWWDVAADAWHPIAPGFSWARRIRVSPAGEYLVEVDQTRSTDWAAGNGLLVRATANWELLPAMPGSENTTGGVAFSLDSRLLATGHMTAIGERARNFGLVPGYQFLVNEYDYLVHVREMPTGRVIQLLDGWQQAVTNLAFSPDGTVLAGTAGPRLRVWDLAADREIALHKRGPKHFQGLSFTHDGRFLATVSNDETVRVWDTRSWREHTTFTWQIGRLLNIAFAPDGLRAAAGSDRGQIVIWDVE
jgi:WD40 repeat protein